MVRSSLHYAESNLQSPLGTNPVQLLTARSDQSVQQHIAEGKQRDSAEEFFGAKYSVE